MIIPFVIYLNLCYLVFGIVFSLVPYLDNMYTKTKLFTGKDIWKFVFNGGEDYELVFTMAPDDFQALQAVYPAVTPIGTVRQGPGRVLLRHDGGEQVLPPTGWTHF